jgi:hypothetical protein
MKLETEEVEENPKDGGQFKGDLTYSNADDNPRSSIPLQSATDIEENSMDMDSEVEIEDDASSCSKDDNPDRISVPVQADIRWICRTD